MNMNNYVLLTDSTIDLDESIVNSLDIDVIPMEITVDEKIFSDGDISHEEFYAKLRNKATSSTSQISPATFKEYFSSIVENGEDVLYLCFSSGLSGMFNSAKIAASEVCKDFPERRIEVIDSLSASIGEGLLVYEMANRKHEGYSMDELIQYANDVRLNVCHWFVVDDLNYLYRGGRLSQTAAIFGSMMNIKPILGVNNDGKLEIKAKVRGKSKAAEYMISQIEAHARDIKNQVVLVGHADCSESARDLADKIKEKFNPKKIIISNLGAVIGSHVGPGMFATAFLGDKR